MSQYFSQRIMRSLDCSGHARGHMIRFPSDNIRRLTAQGLANAWMLRSSGISRATIVTLKRLELQGKTCATVGPITPAPRVTTLVGDCGKSNLQCSYCDVDNRVEDHSSCGPSPSNSVTLTTSRNLLTYRLGQLPMAPRSRDNYSKITRRQTCGVEDDAKYCQIWIQEVTS